MKDEREHPAADLELVGCCRTCRFSTGWNLVPRCVRESPPPGDIPPSQVDPDDRCGQYEPGPQLRRRPGAVSCRTCAFWVPHHTEAEETLVGDCRQDSPAVSFLVSGGGISPDSICTAFPNTGPTQWCHRWAWLNL